MIKLLLSVMERLIFVLLLSGAAFTSCENGERSGFWVNWTFAKTGDASQAARQVNANPNLAAARSSPTPPQRVVTAEPNHEALAIPHPSATPTPSQVINTASAPEITEPVASPPTRPVLSQPSDVPYAKPVPGKPGYVFSPFDTKGGYVDVTGYSPGSMVKDPYSGKIFRVP